MKRFEFKLQTVLDLKVQLCEDKKRIFAHALNAVMNEEGNIQNIAANINTIRVELAHLEGKGSLDMFAIKNHRRYIRGLQRSLSESSQKLNQMRLELEKKRNELATATKEKKALEKLKERHKKKYEYALALEEKKFLDDISSVQFILNKNKEALL